MKTRPIEYKFSDIFEVSEKSATSLIPISIAGITIAPGIEILLDETFNGFCIDVLLDASLYGYISNGIYTIESYGIGCINYKI